jgi:hypothetical protein
VAARVTGPARAAALLGLALVAAGCGVGAGTGGAPVVMSPAPVATAPALAPAPAATRAAIFAALGRERLIVADTATPYRPAESTPLAAAPRTVYQVTLPADPNEGFIVVYEFPTDALAADAARAQVAYLGSGPGRVQTPSGTDHVLQQLGPTVIVYDWLPGAALDPQAPLIAEALRTVGTSFDVR